MFDHHGKMIESGHGDRLAQLEKAAQSSKGGSSVAASQWLIIGEFPHISQLLHGKYLHKHLTINSINMGFGLAQWLNRNVSKCLHAGVAV